MADHIPWKTHAYKQGICVSAIARGRVAREQAVATAEVLLLDPQEYGVPVNIPRELVFRFSRCKAEPKGMGGGSVVLRSALDILDEIGAWAVLEASPYPGTTKAELHAFYEKHGFQHNPAERGIMFRPPGGP